MCGNDGFRRGIRRIGGPAMPILLVIIFCAIASGRTITIASSGLADFTTTQAAINDANAGDVNRDYAVDFRDLSIMMLHWLEEPQ